LEPAVLIHQVFGEVPLRLGVVAAVVGLGIQVLEERVDRLVLDVDLAKDRKI
jgi:hypothetical protein